MDLMKLGGCLLTKQFSGSVSEGQAGNALSALPGDGQGGLDIASLVSKFAGGGSGPIVGSWLGDGANQGINATRLMQVFGGDKLSAFAGDLGIDQESATPGLANVLPSLVDQGSSGSSLLDSVGGLGGALGMAQKLF